MKQSVLESMAYQMDNITEDFVLPEIKQEIKEEVTSEACCV